MKRILSAALRLRVWKDTRGQDLIEYALIAGFIAVAAAAAIPQVTDAVTNIFSAIGGRLNTNAGKI